MDHVLEIGRVAARREQCVELPLDALRMVQIVVVPLAQHVAARVVDADVAQRAERAFAFGRDDPDILAPERCDMRGDRGPRFGGAFVENDHQLGIGVRLRAIRGNARGKYRKRCGVGSVTSRQLTFT